MTINCNCRIRYFADLIYHDQAPESPLRRKIPWRAFLFFGSLAVLMVQISLKPLDWMVVTKSHGKTRIIGLGIFEYTVISDAAKKLHRHERGGMTYTRMI
jgi:hypothetical protein